MNVCLIAIFVVLIIINVNLIHILLKIHKIEKRLEGFRETEIRRQRR